MTSYAGVDLGATTVSAAVGDGSGQVAGRADAETPGGPDGAAVVDAVLETLQAACTEAGVATADLRAVGVGSMGPLADGAVADPPNLPAVDRVDLAGPLADLAGTDDVTVLNDAVAGVVGERSAADPAPDDLVYLTVSTGLGAGACVDGHVLAGRDGNAAEVGHLPLDPSGAMTCGCGGVGHWEAYCSGRNVPRYARHLHDGEATSLSLDGDLTAREVYDAAGADAFATRVVERVTDWNVRGVTSLVAAYAPARLAVGGAVALENPERVVAPLRERVPDRLMVDAPTIRTASLGRDAVVRGALVAAGRGVD